MFPIQSLAVECEVCLSNVGSLRWQNLFLVIVESAILQLQAPGGAYIWRGDLTEGFFTLPVWGAYILRGLFSEFYGTSL